MYAVFAKEAAASIWLRYIDSVHNAIDDRVVKIIQNPVTALMLALSRNR